MRIALTLLRAWNCDSVELAEGVDRGPISPSISILVVQLFLRDK